MFEMSAAARARPHASARCRRSRCRKSASGREPVTPPPRATEPVAEPPAVVEPSAELQPAAPPQPAPIIDFDEARQRAAEEIVTERSAEKEYLTFSIDDVAAPRPAEEPEPERSIFDPAPALARADRGATGSAANEFRAAHERALQRAHGRLQPHGLRQLLRRGQRASRAACSPRCGRPTWISCRSASRRATRRRSSLAKARSRPSSAVSSSKRTPRTNPKISRCL